MKRFLFYLIQFTWGLPQNIVGLICYLTSRKNGSEKFFHSRIAYRDGNFGGISLGIFIILNRKRESDWLEKAKVHEYGHTLQSLILGWLYFPIIGIPSALWCNLPIMKEKRKNENISYYSFYPEKWANTLGTRATGLPTNVK